jgi:APA family basic amino acid/polyamine antiporter
MTTFIRSIGRWTMTGLVINATIGSSMFAIPGVLSRLLGRASPIAVLLAGLGLAVIMAAIIEVASQFRDAGGAYVYTRVAFGRFWGLQVGWFWLLSLLAGAAAAANVFVAYLAEFVPAAGNGWGRGICITIVIAVPTLANCLGVKQGANLCNLLTVAKILPLSLIVGLGLLRFHSHIELIRVQEITGSGWGAWVSALLILLGAMGGAEDTLAPTGEVDDPRRTIPFGFAMGLLICVPLYMFVQFITVATPGVVSATDRPLVDVANVLIGHAGTRFISTAVLFSTYGMLAAGIMNAPRLTYALAAQGDFPNSLSEIHPSFHTPVFSIGLFSVLLWILAVTGSFLWLIVVTAGSMAVEYIGMCAALIRLRRLRPDADALRIPWGRQFAVLGILICAVLLTSLRFKQLLFMGFVALVGAGNWWWSLHRAKKSGSREGDTAAPSQL